MIYLTFVSCSSTIIDFVDFVYTTTDRVGVVLLNRELQYEYFYDSYIFLVTDDICTMFGSDIIPEEENIDIAYFCHTVMDKKYPQDSGV